MNKTLLAQKLGGNLGTVGPFDPTNTGSGGQSIANLFSTLFTFFTTISSLSFIVYFVLGALKWITAGGDQQKVDTAKNQMTNAAIGLIIIVAAYAIVEIVGAAIGINILSPVETINNLNLPGSAGGGGGGGSGVGSPGGGYQPAP